MSSTLPGVVHADGTVRKYEEKKVVETLKKRRIGPADRKSIILRLRAALRARNAKHIGLDELRELIARMAAEVTGRGPEREASPKPTPERTEESRPAEPAGPEPPLDGPPGRFFTWDEFEASATATEKGIDNRILPEARAAIRALCTKILDHLRMVVGEPVMIRSGYRSAALNVALQGAPQSQHMKGEAADIKTSSILHGQRAAEWLAAAIVESGVPFDQVVWYHPSKGGHVHISYSISRSTQRGQTLYRDGTGYHPKTPRR